MKKGTKKPRAKKPRYAPLLPSRRPLLMNYQENSCCQGCRGCSPGCTYKAHAISVPVPPFIFLLLTFYSVSSEQVLVDSGMAIAPPMRARDHTLSHMPPPPSHKSSREVSQVRVVRRKPATMTMRKRPAAPAVAASTTAALMTTMTMRTVPRRSTTTTPTRLTVPMRPTRMTTTMKMKTTTTTLRMKMVRMMVTPPLPFYTLLFKAAKPWFLQCLSSQSPLSPPQIKAVGFPPLLLNALEQVIQFKFLLCLIVYIFMY